MTLLILKETFFNFVVAFLQMNYLLPKDYYGDQVYIFKSAFLVAYTTLHPATLVGPSVCPKHLFKSYFFNVLGHCKVCRCETLLQFYYVTLQYCPCPTVSDFCSVLGLFYLALCFSAGLLENMRREPRMLCQKNY